MVGLIAVAATTAVAAVAIGYVLGTFPSAVLIARANGVDITTVGSGNPGASNVTRTLGWRKGAWVYALDAVKGSLATAVGLAVDGRALGYACGAAAMLGHMYPVWRPSQGGKGVATGSGVLVVLHPIIFLSATTLWFAIARLTKRAALASLVVLVLVPAGMLALGAPLWEFIAAAGLCALIVARHAGNIQRMLRREEHRIH